MALKQGDVLQGRYRVVSVLGQGGMGAVYRARDIRLNVYVALKEMVPQPGLDSQKLNQLRLQFQREAHILARLNHPHLVRVIDFFAEGGNTYLVMDFVEGESLAERVKRKGALSEEEVLGWTEQLLDALDYCHAQNIIHRDIKPPNVTIRPDGLAVLVDFGLVKLWDPESPRTDTLIRGMGTPAYAPPEQYSATLEHTDPRADIFSLGATLYFALTGQDPPSAMERMAAPNLLVSVRTLNPSVSLQVEKAVIRSMALSISDRFESAAAMRQYLKRGQDHLPSAKRGREAPWLGRVLSQVGAFLDSVASREPNVSPPKSSPPPSHPTDSKYQLITTGHMESSSVSEDVSTRCLRSELKQWTNLSHNLIVEDLILQEDFRRLKDFIVHAEGGRFVITGYGRFGGTSIIRGVMQQARRDLRRLGAQEGALAVFYFNISKTGEHVSGYEVEANQVSFGFLTGAQESGELDTDLMELEAKSDQTSSLEFLGDRSSLRLQLTKPLNASFLAKSNLSSLLPSKSKAYLSVDEFVTEVNNFVDGKRDNSQLQKMMLRLLESNQMPSRVIIVLDRVDDLEALETLAQLDLFEKRSVTVIAVSHKERFDDWIDKEERLSSIGFREWYVPCLWGVNDDYLAQIEQVLLEPPPLGIEMDEDIFHNFRRHLEFLARGALGRVLEEMKHPRYWSYTTKGRAYLNLDHLADDETIQHNAWLQQVLDLNWQNVLGGLIVGPNLAERKDRAKIGVYHVLDWMSEHVIFHPQQLQKAIASELPFSISEKAETQKCIVARLLFVLRENRYLVFEDELYRVTWDRASDIEPYAIKRENLEEAIDLTIAEESVSSDPTDSEAIKEEVDAVSQPKAESSQPTQGNIDIRIEVVAGDKEKKTGGSDTNINVRNLASGKFESAVSLNGGEAVDQSQSQGPIYKPSDEVEQDFDASEVDKE